MYNADIAYHHYMRYSIIAKEHTNVLKQHMYSARFDDIKLKLMGMWETRYLNGSNEWL